MWLESSLDTWNVGCCFVWFLNLSELSRNSYWEGNHSVKSWKWCKMLPHKVLTVDYMINTVCLLTRLLCEWTSLGNSLSPCFRVPFSWNDPIYFFYCCSQKTFNNMRRFRKPAQRELPFRVNREPGFFPNSSLKRLLSSVTFLILENWQLLNFFWLVGWHLTYGKAVRKYKIIHL